MDAEIAYNQALDYLYSFVDYSLKHASELAKADFNLDRMVALLAELGNPHHAYPTIHVAGTKGKGSTSAFCASALKSAGYRTGLYTSPHLQDYTERIRVDGVPISHLELAELVESVKPAVSHVPFLTTFEITTAIGFLAFARRGVNAAVIEVGLGGRLDATNVVTPDVSVITSLSYDHMLVLGDTLAKIAGEKAGIIKSGHPVVSSPQKDEALEVIKRVSAERSAPMTLVGRDVLYSSLGHTLHEQRMLVEWRNRPSLELTIPLLGAHQIVNAATAYAAMKAGSFRLSDPQIQEGFASVEWRARFEIARQEPPVIFDSAHNQDSFEKLTATLDEYLPDRPVYLIFGASEDKLIKDMFNAIKPRLKKVFLTKADHPRALEPEAIQKLAEQVGLETEIVTPVAAAFSRALDLSAKDGSIVLSAGSMFVTAEGMTAWDQLNKLQVTDES
ncbi:MAG TPA: folylpolyglutamate synthase/dihydrofolate synthase family protein [Longilinea sp.]|nr:folylpolyglutamate synthase/dihydrofolate synthase family protein [Longilinea sp.]